MEGGDSARTFILYFILALGIGLFVLQVIDAKKIVNSFGDMNNYDNNFVEDCIKYPLFAQSVLLGIQMIICLFLIIFAGLNMLAHSTFTSAISTLNLKLLIYTIGPIILGFCTLGFIYWNDVCYSCTNIYLKEKQINVFTVITLIMLFVISFVVTISKASFEVLFFQIDSLLRKPEGSEYARKSFWYFASKSRANEDYQIIQNRFYQENRMNNDEQNNNQSNHSINEQDQGLNPRRNSIEINVENDRNLNNNNEESNNKRNSEIQINDKNNL